MGFLFKSNYKRQAGWNCKMHNFSVLMASLLSLDFADDERVQFPSRVFGVSVRVGEVLVLASAHAYPKGGEVSVPRSSKGHSCFRALSFRAISRL